MHVHPDRELVRLARQQVSDRITLTGQLLPAPVVDEASDLLACIWTCGQARVLVNDWRRVTSLPQVVVDVLVITRPRRARDDA